MKKNLLSKTLALGIVVLFIGVGVYSAIAIESKSSLNNKQSEPDLYIFIKSGDKYATGIEKLFGCYCSIQNWGDEPKTANASFNVTSFNLKGEYLGASTKFYSGQFPPELSLYLHLIPDYYGELITWVKATVEIKNGEQTESEIGISIGKWIHFFYFLN